MGFDAGNVHLGGFVVAAGERRLEAFHQGTLIHVHGGVRRSCAKAPGKHLAPYSSHRTRDPGHDRHLECFQLASARGMDGPHLGFAGWSMLGLHYDLEIAHFCLVGGVVVRADLCADEDWDACQRAPVAVRLNQGAPPVHMDLVAKFAQNQHRVGGAGWDQARGLQ